MSSQGEISFLMHLENTEVWKFTSSLYLERGVLPGNLKTEMVAKKI